MKSSEAASLLALAAAYDNRVVAEVTSAAWADALSGLAVGDCADAVRAHYRECDGDRYLMPAHVRTHVRDMLRAKAAEARDADTWAAIAPGAEGRPATPEAIRRIRLEVLAELAAKKGLPPLDKTPRNAR